MSVAEPIPFAEEYRDLVGSQVRIRQIVTALAIADHGSIAAASEALHTAQPAVSRTLLQLESAIGITLFHRLPRGMRLTAEGELFLPHARSVATGLLELERHLREVRSGSAGTIRIGTVVAGSADLIPLAIARFTNMNPNVKFGVVEAGPDSLYANLLSGELDIVIGRLLPLSEREHVDSEAFYQDTAQVLVRSGHPLVGGRPSKSLSLGDLVDDAWILPPPATTLRSQIDRSFETNCGRTPKRVVECVTMPTVRRLLIESDHIAVVPSGALGSDETSGDLLARLNVQVTDQAVPIGVIKRSGVPLSRACEEFLDVVRAIGDPTTGASLQR